MEQQAFVLRIAPSRIDRIAEALDRNQLIIGWAEAVALLNDRLSWEEFRTIISDTYYSQEETLRKAGAAGGHMWRFIGEMTEGDLVVVPHGSGFHVARVTGSATYDQSKVDEDTAYRRNVDWLNKKASYSSCDGTVCASCENEDSRNLCARIGRACGNRRVY